MADLPATQNDLPFDQMQSVATSIKRTKIFGVYTHSRPDGRIFYVGKGVEKRSRDMVRNQWHDAVVAKYGKKNIGVKFMPCDSEAAAFEFEVFLISELRLSGVELTNMTDGGEGVSGFTFSAESRAARSARQKGYKPTPEAIEKTAASRRGTKHTPEALAKMSASHKGSKLTEEQRKKLSLSLRGKKKPPRSVEHRAKLSAAVANISQETRMKMSQAHLGKKLSADTKAKLSNIQKLRHKVLREQKMVGGGENE